MTDTDEDRRARWAAVYGAAVAAECYRNLSEGVGLPIGVEWDRVVETAEALANESELAWRRVHGIDEVKP